MDGEQKPTIVLPFQIPIDHPELLQGLDDWLARGLLSEAEVREFCCGNLSCAWLGSEFAIGDAIETITTTQDSGEDEDLRQDLRLEEPIEPATELDELDDVDLVDLDDVDRSPPVQPLTRIIQALMTELSLRWLLFLGVFVTVASSGVLAANLWQRSNAAVQCAVLLVYTIAFFVASNWIARSPRLRLTTFTLQIVTGLLVPVNFWAMDGLGLWQLSIGPPVLVLFTLVLGFILFTLPQSDQKLTDQKLTDQKLSYDTRTKGLLLGLGMLHWGWSNPFFGLASWPLVAVYLGVVGPLMVLLLSQRDENAVDLKSMSHISGENIPSSPLPRFLTLGRILLLGTIAILLFRGIFVVQRNVAEMGLAIALSGWLFTWATRRDTWRDLNFGSTLSRSTVDRDGPSGVESGVESVMESGVAFGVVSRVASGEQTFIEFVQPIVEIIGGGLILLGWLVTVDRLVWQTWLISILGLVFWQQRLTRFWQRRDWFCMMVIALQLSIQTWRLISPGSRSLILTWATQFTDTQDTPWALLSLAWFPYILVLLVSANWFMGKDQTHLTRFSDLLGLALGTCLIVLSLVSSVLTTTMLLLVTLATLTVTYRPTLAYGRFSIYLTQALGLLTLASAIHWVYPSLNLGGWAIVALMVMFAEWGWSLRRRPNTVRAQRWYTSAWHSGLALAGISYCFLFLQVYLQIYFTADRGTGLTRAFSHPAWGLAWIAVASGLTAIAYCHPQRRNMAIRLSTIALVLLQTLTLPVQEVRIPALILATVMMVLNSGLQRRRSLAIVTIGFGLLALIVTLSEGTFGLPRPDGFDWLILAAVMLNGFWILQQTGQQRNQGEVNTLFQIYREATDFWGKILVAGLLLVLTLHVVVLQRFVAADLVLWKSTLAAGLTTIAIAHRTRPWLTDKGLYVLAWAVEITLLEGLAWHGLAALHGTIAHLVLAFVTEFWGDWWCRRQVKAQHLTSLHVIPLVYGMLALLSRATIFGPWTGLSTLAIAFLCIKIGRRKRNLQWLTYGGLIGFTLATYELLGYALRLQTWDTQCAALAGLTIGIAYFYRVPIPLLQRYLQLPIAVLLQVAHLHWGGATLLLWCSLLARLDGNDTFSAVKLVTGLLVVVYALVQGRQRRLPRAASIVTSAVSLETSPQTRITWVYAGFVQCGAIVLYGWSLAPRSVQAFLSVWMVAIVAPLCMLIFLAPWQAWGWPAQPWKNLSLGLPVGLTLVTWNTLNAPGLMVAAIGYTVLAKYDRKIRLTYLSWLFLDFAIWRWSLENNFTPLLWYSLPLGLSFLWVAHVDPILLQPVRRETRHTLRIVGSSLICGVALLPGHGPGLIAGGVSFVTLMAGLMLRIRAFLFVGTLAFLGNLFYQSIVLVRQQSLVKWAVGLLVGVGLIWIAATFETRREQIRTLLQNWTEELESWE